MKILLVFFALIASACNSPFGSVQPYADKAVEAITCENSESRMFDVLYASLLEEDAIPNEQQLRKIFEKALDKNPHIQIEEAEFLSLVSDFSKVIAQLNAKDPKHLLEKITALEVGDQTTFEAQTVQTEYQNFRTKWKAYSSALDTECSELAPSPVEPPQSAPGSVIDGMVYGARKVLVTAYQSCSANEKDPMDANTQDVRGITVTGTHENGEGLKRVISDLRAVQQTHYYLQNLGQSSSCKDVRENPPIYDYGGKPYATADENSSLDLFKNTGSGTSVLGIDCSGYVFSAIAAGGLKLDPAKKLKAIQVHGINSRMYMNPEVNGMPCFGKVKMGVSGTLQAGDIAALPGHVFLIDSVGEDPLAVNKVKTAAECANISYKDFDFVVAQSSPSKEGIGINKYIATAYLAEESGIRAGFEKYARDACKSKFQSKDSLIVATNFQLIRHKRSPSCLDRPIALKHETCANSCGPLVHDSELNVLQSYKN